MTQEPLLHLLIVNAHRVYTSSMVGDPCPSVAAQYEVVRNPVVGSLVMEISSIHRKDLDMKRFGRLLRIEARPVHQPEDWNEEEEGRPMPTEPVYVVENVDGKTCEWTNARFIRVLEDFGW